MIKTYSATRSTYTYSSLRGFYQLEYNIVLLCLSSLQPCLRSKTPLAEHDHLITPNTEFLMAIIMAGDFPAAVLSEQTGGEGFCQVTVYTGEISPLIPHLYTCLPNRKKEKKGAKKG